MYTVVVFLVNGKNEMKMKWNESYWCIKKKKSKGNITEFKLLGAARRRAQESPRYVAPGTDCSPGSNIVNVVQVQRLIVILKYIVKA